ncbi:hypothetical protein [Acidiferrobacter sp.]|jgi:hypothetical protein|uniref:DUF7673 family protein n=1 Tax=Acidiferrobacter sp. TaxID=1872107 RepID=UPI002634ADBC|nr:hypothetical protein [Acidiferrobacter sp.]
MTPTLKQEPLPDWERLWDLAARDTSGGRRIARVLLSLWDGATFSVDLQDLLCLDPGPFHDLLALLAVLHRENLQLDRLVTSHQMQPILRLWGSVPPP